MGKKIVLAQPKVNKADGKKDWQGLYDGMDDKALVKHAAGVLNNMPMTYLSLLGQALLKRVAK